MKYNTTLSVVVLVCSLAFGCNKPAEPPKPDPTKAPPAPPAASVPAGSAAAPTLPVPSDGPKLPDVTPPKPPMPSASVTGPTLTPPPGGPELPKPGANTSAPLPGFAKRPAADDLKVVQEVIAKQMKLKPEDVKPTATLDELKMSNLDYSDVVELLEQRLNITISKLALKKAAGVDMDYDVIEKLTVQKMADAINAIPPKQ